MRSIPRITIGLPVYNGAATIEDSMMALLSQTFSDFELIVCDNASTDQTEEVVRSVAASDSRVRYVRQAKNIGANGNYSYAARLARGEFFKWATASDWCAPTFLERCFEALDQDPGAVLAAPLTRYFEGQISNAWDAVDDIEITGGSPLARLQTVLARMTRNNAMNGLIRRSSLFRTQLIGPYVSADMVLMGHLAMLGRFTLVRERLFYRRMELATSTALQDTEAVRRHHYPVVGANTLLQHWKWHLGWLRAATTARMPFSERIRAVGLLARRMAWDREALADDLGEAWRYAWRPTG